MSVRASTVLLIAFASLVRCHDVHGPFALCSSSWGMNRGHLLAALRAVPAAAGNDDDDDSDGAAGAAVDAPRLRFAQAIAGANALAGDAGTTRAGRRRLRTGLYSGALRRGIHKCQYMRAVKQQRKAEHELMAVVDGHFVK